MRACVPTSSVAVAFAGMLLAALAPGGARAQSLGNLLRSETDSPAPRVARSQPAAAPRRFTEAEVWGDDVRQSLQPGRNPLRQVQLTEDLPPPAGPTPQQALAQEEWSAVGPHAPYAEDPTQNGFLSHAWFVHTDPNDPHRAIGWGEPLVGTSWRNRPWYIGGFIGGIFNGDLIAGHVEQNNTALGGARLGFDFDHYWGIEGRFGYANPFITQPDGTPLGVSRNYLADVELLYYPWGDSHWRPYITAGLGQATFRFTDDQNRVVHESLLSLPLGVGLKYFYSPWFTLRFDLVENFAFGSHTLDNQANLSLMAGVEYRFGGRRPSYFPWHGNTAGW